MLKSDFICSERVRKSQEAFRKAIQDSTAVVRRQVRRKYR